jgi:DNA-binding IclR family transcriptional regulator
MAKTRAAGAVKAAVKEVSVAVADSGEVGVSAVNRALSILAAFSREQPRLSLAQLAQATGLYKSTILRLAESLESFGYLQRSADGIYSIGSAPLRLAPLYQTNLHPAEIILPTLRELVARTQESASFYVQAGDQRLCAYRVHSPRSVRDHINEGELLPLNRGAGGVILMAFSGARGARYEAARREKFALTRGDRDPETAAIAAPVFGVGNKLEGALCVSGPLHRFDDASVEAMREPLQVRARALTEALGGDADSMNY